MRRILAVAAVAALVAGALGPTQTVLAAAPANDNFADAIAINPSGLPFGDVVDNTAATTELGEPSWCGPASHTVWYSFTPAVGGVLTADMSGSTFSDTNLTVYVAFGPGLSGLGVVGGGSGSACFGGIVKFSVQAGSTYFIQAGSVFSGGGSLHLNVAAVPPPSNDNFVDATLIASLPFSGAVDATASTVEPGEPYDPTCIGAPANSVWYKVTPSSSGSLSVSVPEFWSSFAVFSGDSFASLTRLGCHNFGGMVTFSASAGVTYHLQLVPLNPIGAGGLHLTVMVTPPPQSNFSLSPHDPSVVDTVQFTDASYDPAGVGFASSAWDFGDGATASGCCPTHRFAADADYTVMHSVATYDGRTAATSQVIRVATHDVTIAKFTAPVSASPGQTRQITVGLTDSHYPEMVAVQLFKSDPSGPSVVGALTQAVTVRGPNRTTAFTFNYTFTPSDSIIGKVTFRAEASIQGFRDALPDDNVAIAFPTKVNR